MRKLRIISNLVLLIFSMVIIVGNLNLVKASESQLISDDYEYTVDGGNATITDYTGSGGEVVIPSQIDEYTVTGIDEWAFYGNITSVTIPSSVTSISSMAFNCCYSLEKINVDSENTAYCSEDGVLYNKSKTTLITYPKNKQGLQFTIPSSVTNIGEGAFDNCTSLTSVVIPSSVTSIGEGAFSCCTSLTSIEIPSSVTSIGEGAFSYCISLTSIDIPSSVTSIGEGAFSYCNGLEKINVNSGNNAYSSGDGVLYNKSKTTLITYPIGKAGSQFTIPSSVTSIGEWAFCNCISLTSVQIPSGVTSIGGWAFCGCIGLKSIDIPSSVTSIGDVAFANCTSLTNVVIPNSVTNIGDNAFGDCTSLTSVDIPSGVTSIGEGTFSYCNSLASVTIPSSVTSIGCLAFSQCESLASIDIPNSVTSIGEWAFCGCTRLTSIEIPSSVINIGEGAFSYCNGLTSVVIPSSVTSMGYMAFGYCSSLTNINIQSGVTSIGEGVFYGCSGLKSIDIPSSVTSIGDVAFAGCTSLTNVVIPNNVTNIGNNAFSDCTSLTSVDIPSGVTSIGEEAFSCCEKLVNVTIPSNVTIIDEYAFYKCSNLISAKFLGNAPTIGKKAFDECSSSFKIYYIDGKAGFTTPTWNGYPTEPFSLTDSEKLQEDKKSLELGNISAVTADLTLPSTGENGSTITWKSSNKNVVTDAGKVTRPAAGQTDAEVTLTATLVNGTATDTKVFQAVVKAQEPQGVSDADKVALDKAALSLGDISAVKTNLTLPSTGLNGSTITWKSNNINVIGNDGKVTRPAMGQADVMVILTATIKKGEAEDTKTFQVVVKAQESQGTSDADKVALDKAALSLGDISEVISNLTLPSTGANGTTITWKSSNTRVLSNDGKVTRPAMGQADVTVTLTATIKKGEATDTKTFEVVIKAQSMTDAYIVKNDKDSLKLENINSVENNLVLPTAGVNGSTITWKSNNTNVIGNDGKVTRPEPGQKDVKVKLTATITKGNESATKEFNVKVIALPITDKYIVEKDCAALDLGDLSAVTADLKLITNGANKSTITWKSDNSSVISIKGTNGKVTRPAIGQPDVVVTLTATITKGNESLTKKFTATVKAQQPTDSDLVAKDKEALNLENIGAVTSNLILPSTGANGTTITWKSNNIKVLGNDGKVTRPEPGQKDATVKLTATISKGKSKAKKEFKITVKAQEFTDEYSVAKDKETLNLGNMTSIEKDLTLPTSGANGTTITWSSNNKDVVTDDGKVTRPEIGEEDVQVVLTATITKGEVKDTKTFDLTIKAQAMTDEYIVSKDKEALDLGDTTEVVNNLTLPTKGANGSTIKWSSKNKAVSSNGKVTRPAMGQPDAVVTLTATIKKGKATDTKTFEVVVKAQPMTDAYIVKSDKDSLKLENINLVENDLDLPVTGVNGSTITWLSSNTDVLGNDGTVTRPEPGQKDITVTLTATITKGDEIVTKIFKVKVKALPITDGYVVERDYAALDLGDLSAVEGNLKLPTKGAKGSKIKWESDNTSVISTTGKVTRPAAGQEDVTVTLTATITKGKECVQKTFTVTVLAK